jgi:hypothetical protein
MSFSCGLQYHSISHTKLKYTTAITGIMVTSPLMTDSLIILIISISSSNPTKASHANYTGSFPELFIFSRCITQITLHNASSNSSESEISQFYNLLFNFHLLHSTPYILEVNLANLNNSSPTFINYVDPEKYLFHQTLRSQCFLKFYFLLDLSPPSWRQIFYTERTTRNLNRIPEFLIILAANQIETESVSGLELPWSFLIDKSPLLPYPTLNFFTPAKIFVYSNNSISVLCFLCRSPQELLVPLNPNDYLNHPYPLVDLEISWLQVHRNLQGHTILFEGGIPSESQCDLFHGLQKGDKDVDRKRFTPSKCFIVTVARYKNFTINDKIAVFLRKVAVMGNTKEDFYNYKIREIFSYKAMRQPNSVGFRFEAIHVDGHLEHFTYLVIIRNPSRFNINALWNCFHPKVWRTIFLAGVLTVLATFLIFFKTFRLQEKLWFLLYSVSLVVFASLIEQSRSPFTKTSQVYTRIPYYVKRLSPARLIICCWVIIAFVFSSSYKSVLYSVLIKPPSISIPKNIHELTNEKHGLSIVTSDTDSLDNLIDHIEGIKGQQNLSLPLHLQKLHEQVISASSKKYKSQNIPLVQIFHSIHHNDKTFLKSENDDNSTSVTSLNPKKFAIFDSILKLKRLQKFIHKFFPSFKVFMSPTLDQDLIKMYHWTCTRTIMHPIFDEGAMHLNEAGFYDIWHEYFLHYEERREIQEFEQEHRNLYAQKCQEQDAICLAHQSKAEHDEIYENDELKNGILNIETIFGFLASYAALLTLPIAAFCIERTIFILTNLKLIIKAATKAVSRKKSNAYDTWLKRPYNFEELFEGRLLFTNNMNKPISIQIKPIQ